MTIVRRSHVAAVVLAASVPALIQSQPSGVARSFKIWSQYLGGADSSQYSSLDQINRSTVSRMDVAWRYPSGDTRSYRFNPIVVDGTMYVLAKNNAIVALDPLTGAEKWAHPNEGAVGDRGINYWESRDRSDRRLLYLNAGSLTAIDARTGATITAFGDRGKVDVRTALGRDRTNMRPLQTNNPGRIYQDLFIISLPAGGAGYVANPGDVHAYDVRTGKLVWVFHTVPMRGEAGAETWPDSALDSGSGVHNWAELTVDDARGIVYIPTGTARYDFYGGNRHGANLYANSIVALDAKTGTLKWHFQTVHHDLWDYDLATAPKLLTVKHDGRDVDVVAQASKHGFLFVLERDTGRPLWPIEERPVPQTDVPGEQTSPTQPFPTAPPPFARQSFTEKDVNPHVSAESQAQLRDLLRNSVNKGLFTPPSLQGSIQMPGNSGGANWGLSAVDPVKGRVYVVSKEAPSLLKLREMKPGTPAEPRGPDARTLPPNPPSGFVPYTAVGPYGWVDRPSGLPHRTALVPALSVRSEQGHAPVAGPERRYPPARGQGRARHGQPGRARRHGGNRRRPRLHRHTGPHAACVRRGHGPRGVVAGDERTDKWRARNLRARRTPVPRGVRGRPRGRGRRRLGRRARGTGRRQRIRRLRAKALGQSNPERGDQRPLRACSNLIKTSVGQVTGTCVCGLNTLPMSAASAAAISSLERNVLGSSAKTSIPRVISVA
jgi:outer membrane protein assembly factor BamB